MTSKSKQSVFNSIPDVRVTRKTVRKHNGIYVDSSRFSREESIVPPHSTHPFVLKLIRFLDRVLMVK